MYHPNRVASRLCNPEAFYQFEKKNSDYVIPNITWGIFENKKFIAVREENMKVEKKKSKIGINFHNFPFIKGFEQIMDPPCLGVCTTPIHRNHNITILSVKPQ